MHKITCLAVRGFMPAPYCCWLGIRTSPRERAGPSIAWAMFFNPARFFLSELPLKLAQILGVFSLVIG
ncbi:hypothetical protein Holit_02022 [Hollandina sp. SP2]